jgi:hypothetical protein
VSWRLFVRQERGNSSTTGGVMIAKTMELREGFSFLCLLFEKMLKMAFAVSLAKAVLTTPIMRVLDVSSLHDVGTVRRSS